MKLLVIVLVAASLAQARRPAPISIIRQNQELRPDGSYEFGFDTGDGILRDERGFQEQDGSGQHVEGVSVHTAPDGTVIKLKYRAGVDGVQVEGDHLPVAPDIPPIIKKLLKYLRRKNKSPHEENPGTSNPNPEELIHYKEDSEPETPLLPIVPANDKDKIFPFKPNPILKPKPIFKPIKPIFSKPKVAPVTRPVFKTQPKPTPAPRPLAKVKSKPLPQHPVRLIPKSKTQYRSNAFPRRPLQ